MSDGPEISRGDGADVPPAAGSPRRVGPIGTPPRYGGRRRNRRSFSLGSPWLWAAAGAAVVAGFVAWNMLDDTNPDTRADTY